MNLSHACALIAKFHSILRRSPPNSIFFQFSLAQNRGERMSRAHRCDDSPTRAYQTGKDATRQTVLAHQHSKPLHCAPKSLAAGIKMLFREKDSTWVVEDVCFSLGFCGITFSTFFCILIFRFVFFFVFKWFFYYYS